MAQHPQGPHPPSRHASKEEDGVEESPYPDKSLGFSSGMREGGRKGKGKCKPRRRLREGEQPGYISDIMVKKMTKGLP
jgi:hypothetical protein